MTQDKTGTYNLSKEYLRKLKKIFRTLFYENM